jgi:hypothetical protein
MKRGELCHDLCVIMFLTDHVVMMPEYHGKIPVGDKLRGTEVIYKTCEEVNIGTHELYARTMDYVQAPYLSPGFSDCEMANSRSDRQ